MKWNYRWWEHEIWRETRKTPPSVNMLVYHRLINANAFRRPNSKFMWFWHYYSNIGICYQDWNIFLDGHWMAWCISWFPIDCEWWMIMWKCVRNSHRVWIKEIKSSKPNIYVIKWIIQMGRRLMNGSALTNSMCHLLSHFAFQIHPHEWFSSLGSVQVCYSS